MVRCLSTDNVSQLGNALSGNVSQLTCDAIVDRIVHVYNITDFDEFEVMRDNFTLSSNVSEYELISEEQDLSNVTHLTTTFSPQQQKVERLCLTEIPSELLFERFDFIWSPMCTRWC